jgi:hypothetical protein
MCIVVWKEFKEAVSRDFRPLVFFVNHLSLEL